MQEKLWKWLPLAAVACICWFGITAITGMSRPSSIFCCYKIYKQPDGTYEVWWRGRISWRELDHATYEQAKAFQIEKCKTFWNFPHPTGESVK